MKKDPLIFIDHILESISAVKDYVAGLDKKKFFESTQVQDAVIRRVEIIGEAVRNFPKDIIREHPEVPWREIVDMRNLLIHEYFSVDLQETWNVIKQDLPKLERQIEKIKDKLKIL